MLISTAKGSATFSSTSAAAAWLAEMQPAFCDVDGESFSWETQDDDDLEIEAARDALVAALVAVHADALAEEADAAGDREMAIVCSRAIDGDMAAGRQVVAAVEAARAMAEA